jgi:hypothetical protein
VDFEVIYHGIDVVTFKPKNETQKQKISVN